MKNSTKRAFQAMQSGAKRTGQIVASATAVVATTVHAAVPAGVTTAVGDMATDAAAVATLVLVAIIGVVAIKFIRKGL
jgi:hypothetical protein